MNSNRLRRFMLAIGIGMIWYSVFGYISVSFAIGMAIVLAALLGPRHIN